MPTTLCGCCAVVFSETARSRPGHGEARRNGDDLSAPPVCARRLADDEVERLAEGAEACEADVEADVGDASIGAAEQVERSLDASALQVAMRGLAECRAKCPDEMGFGHARHARERGNVERAAVGEVHGVARAEQPPIRLLCCPGHRAPDGFPGRDRANATPSFTHRCSCGLVRTPSASTRSHPGISRPCITAMCACGRAASSSDFAGSTRTRTPPCPLALIAIFPRTRKARPPNKIGRASCR